MRIADPKPDPATPAVRVCNVSKRFRLGESHDSLRDLLTAAWTRCRRRPSTQSSARRDFWALRDVGFTVSSGEAVGIIGPNGAGKSTILKLLAGILRADAGTVEVQGRLAALIEVGAGFHGDLTGRENIFLNGAILGMTRQEIRSKLDAIAAFAGLGKGFLDTPVKRYSSGMYARLGFSIASHVEPDVLLIDEVLSVGDAVFRLRCLEKMRQLVTDGTALIYVTHDLDQMQSICGRAVVLEKGRVTYEGPSRDAVSHYMQAMSRAYADRPTDLAETEPENPRGAVVNSLRFLNEHGKELRWMHSRESLQLELVFQIKQPIERLVVELNMRAAVHQNLLSLNSGRDGVMFDVKPGQHSLTLTLATLPVSAGQYLWNVRLWDADSGAALLDTPFQYPLVVGDDGPKSGVISVERDWTLDTNHHAQAIPTATAGKVRTADPTSQEKTPVECSVSAENDDGPEEHSQVVTASRT